ncbi:uncharacterized protein LOC116765688 [Danaus plexippus]|uniref:Uncharacterized protein n=1 Tax=Danaus plexippus plexippus TaxID=278856 RepID=A0A212F9G0_DANPL|nr:uncharacterized protein LOC116765688 [Danaus plexippus]OWR50368.1 hypothetical protein KGM_207966 [Danaus plexippus plexippus]
MDCCNYGQYGGAAAGWEGYGYPPMPYGPYHYYSPHAHDYTRYYRYDYAHHMHHNEHAMPMDYGAYAVKEARSRRSLSRRELRALPPTHLPLPHTPPLECGLTGRGPAYCEPQMWSPYQMGMMSGRGWSGANTINGSWSTRSMCLREPVRYTSDCRLMKGSNVHQIQNQMVPQEGRSTPYPVYDESHYNGDNGVKQNSCHDFNGRVIPLPEPSHPLRESFIPEQRRLPPEEKRPPVVPLPAFQQAFGSTEIGKFAEAFSRAEVVHDAEDSSDNFVFESFHDWEGISEEQWTSQPTPKEIKCEDNF